MGGSFAAPDSSRLTRLCSDASGQTASAAGPEALLRFHSWRPNVLRWPSDRGSGARNTVGSGPGENPVDRELGQKSLDTQQPGALRLAEQPPRRDHGNLSAKGSRHQRPRPNNLSQPC